MSRASFNGGPGGIRAVPTERERSFEREKHVEATSEQASHEHMARSDRSNFASENHGRPANPAMSKVGARGENQQDRITTVLVPGPMTASETKYLSRAANINREVKSDRAANGGKLTEERAHVNQQNNVSNSIYNTSIMAPRNRVRRGSGPAAAQSSSASRMALTAANERAKAKTEKNEQHINRGGRRSKPTEASSLPRKRNR